jgi:hypothetical protein
MKKFLTACAAAATLALVAGTVHAGETFEDDCSVSVFIKKPYSESTQFDTSDVLLGKSWQSNICDFLEEPFNMAGVCQTSPGQTTNWTPWIRYSQIANPQTHYFRWICGSTKERSRCESGTNWVRFRLLGGDDEFQTQCSH